MGPEVQFRFHGTVGQEMEMLSRVFTGSALIRSDVIRLATGLVTADLWLAIPSQAHSTTGLLGVKTSVRVSHSYILISFPGLMYGMWPFNIFCSSIPLHIITSPGSFSYCLVFNIPSYPNITFPGSPSYCLFFRSIIQNSGCTYITHI